jgi:hypothetical protein
VEDRGNMENMGGIAGMVTESTGIKKRINRLSKAQESKK